MVNYSKKRKVKNWLYWSCKIVRVANWLNCKKRKAENWLKENIGNWHYFKLFPYIYIERFQFSSNCRDYIINLFMILTTRPLNFFLADETQELFFSPHPSFYFSEIHHGGDWSVFFSPSVLNSMIVQSITLIRMFLQIWKRVLSHCPEGIDSFAGIGNFFFHLQEGIEFLRKLN